MILGDRLTLNGRSLVRRTHYSNAFSYLLRRGIRLRMDICTVILPETSNTTMLHRAAGYSDKRYGIVYYSFLCIYCRHLAPAVRLFKMKQLFS